MRSTCWTYPGRRIATFEVLWLEDGERVWKGMKEIDSSGAGAQPSWPDRFFSQIVNQHLAATQHRSTRRLRALLSGRRTDVA